MTKKPIWGNRLVSPSSPLCIAQITRRMDNSKVFARDLRLRKLRRFSYVVSVKRSLLKQRGAERNSPYSLQESQRGVTEQGSSIARMLSTRIRTVRPSFSPSLFNCFPSFLPPPLLPHPRLKQECRSFESPSISSVNLIYEPVSS